MAEFRKWGFSSRKSRDTYLKRIYGISVGQYDAMMIRQNDCCAICKTPQAKLSKRFAVDHNHKTGKVRGLLCEECNLRVLPTVEYFLNRIDRAKEYLKMSPSVPTLTDIVQDEKKGEIDDTFT